MLILLKYYGFAFVESKIARLPTASNFASKYIAQPLLPRVQFRFIKEVSTVLILLKYYSFALAESQIARLSTASIFASKSMAQLYYILRI